jgi:alcohol dehydrogenase
MGTVFRLPTTVQMGSGVANQLVDHIRALDGERVFVVTDSGVRATGLVERLLAPLEGAGIALDVWDGISSNPRDYECNNAAEQAIAFETDLVVGIGGGSPMDAAKAVAALISNGERVQEWETPRQLRNAPAPMIAIPTTAGTGSEVTFYAVITDTERKFKMSLFDTRLAPSIALVDPDLTYSVPGPVTAATGMDALTHAIEAYTCTLANPVSDALALRAIGLISRYLIAAVRNGDDGEARDGTMTASLIAGMAFGNADVASVHCLAEAIGGLYDTPHGVANSVFLPFVFAHNAEAFPDRHADVAAELGVPREDRAASDIAAEGAAKLSELARAIGIPRLAELDGINPADFPRLAAASAANVSNPSNCRPTDEADYLRLLETAWTASV